jgi:FkbM family methyltransferase
MSRDSGVARLIQTAKNKLVQMGPDNPLTRSALAWHGSRRGFRISFGEAICIQKETSVMRVAKSSFQMIPYMLEYFGLYFRSFETRAEGSLDVLDFSVPAFHRYLKTGREFFFSSIPEEEFGEQYTRFYRPRNGDVVFDLGANAGATACYFAEAVGPAGKVFAFEPDESTFATLLRNIAHSGLKNIVPVKKAVGASTGTATFHMDGTLASGFADLVTYPGTGVLKTVEVLTLEDAILEVGAVPRFVKMDVEGAEIGIVTRSLEYLTKQPIHFAADSSHIVEGKMTCGALDTLFASIGYKVLSSADSGQMFTWATPCA